MDVPLTIFSGSIVDSFQSSHKIKLFPTKLHLFSMLYEINRGVCHPFGKPNPESQKKLLPPVFTEPAGKVKVSRA